MLYIHQRYILSFRTTLECPALRIQCLPYAGIYRARIWHIGCKSQTSHTAEANNQETNMNLIKIQLHVKKSTETFGHNKKTCYLCIAIKKNGSVAQLNRASDYGSEGYRFESCRSHKERQHRKKLPLFVFIKSLFKIKVYSRGICP